MLRTPIVRLAFALVLLAAVLGFPADGVVAESLDGSCSVSRNCDYPPPTSISCSSSTGYCSSGPENYGWVECDGNRTYCPGPCEENGWCNPECPPEGDGCDPDCETCVDPYCSDEVCFDPSQCGAAGGTDLGNGMCICCGPE